MSSDDHLPAPQAPLQDGATARQVVPHLTLRRFIQALHQPAIDERPPGVPKLRYRFPLRWLVGMGRDMLAGRSRSFQDDCALAVHSLPLPPIVEGLEHIPVSGSFILVANHYQRRELWIGWAGALLCDSLWRVRSDLMCHWITEDRAVIDGASVPSTGWMFERVARVWDFVLVTPPEARDADSQRSRRHALRQCLRKLARPDGHSVCLCVMPEGISGSTRGLQQAMPGSGRSLLALAATGIPLLPAAVWEGQDGALHVRFGPAWHPQLPPTIPREEIDNWMGHDVMRRVAMLLPVHFRGPYADENLVAPATS